MNVLNSAPTPVSAGSATSAGHLGAMGRLLHDLRNTAACLRLKREVDSRTLWAWLGHASISTANRYLHCLG